MTFTAHYDWYRLKSLWIGNDFCPPDKWMVVCDVGNGPGFRRYFDTQAQAEAWAKAWIECKHDRTPQPKFNAWGAQCGWWKTNEVAR